MDNLIPSSYIFRCHKALKALDEPLMDWYCVEVVDFSDDSFVCELCGCKKVRYIHVMRHNEHSESIQVGCICAGVMEGNIIAAKERDAKAKRRNQRKSHYLRKQWNAVSDTRWETYYKRKEIIIERDCFKGHDFFKINLAGEHYQWKDNHRMDSFLAAQHYAFDIMEMEVS